MPRAARATGCLLAIGASLLVLEGLLARLGERFLYDVDFSRAPITLFTGLLLAACLIYLALPRVISRLTPSSVLLAAILLIGLLLRLLLFGSNPVLEIDFYRYLWDGAVLAHGFNPWALPPDAAGSGELALLAQQAGPVFTRINYRELSSIYPPLAQAAFALAHWLDPWQADGLRYLWLAADTLGLWLVSKILRHLNLSPYWLCLYWWNPLLVTLTYNGLHMDILLLPLLLATLWLLLQQRQVAACGVLTLAAGIKLWPLLLLPFALRPLLSAPGRLCAALAISAAVASLVLLPMLLLGNGEHSGLLAFGQHWERNSALFPLLHELLSTLGAAADAWARILLAATLFSLVAYLARQPWNEPRQLIRAITLSIAALFLLSPVQLPWYCLWFAPMLCFYPQRALLLLSMLMPLYYLRFYFDFRAEAEIFDRWIVWTQYLPPLLVVLYDRLRDLRPAATGRQHV